MTIDVNAFQTDFRNWYQTHKRDLPWRRDQEPYHVWLSEIMLQQTRVDTVIPYYEKFLKLFPTVQDLANAPEDQLMKAWEGLGYYSRARNLQKAARQIVQDYNGEWPTTAKELQNLAGVGPYTAAAIASISFNEKIPAIDGNAFRVFSRLFEIKADIADPKSRQVFAAAILPLMPDAAPGDFNQAVMDLGSMIATPKEPDIAHDPLRKYSLSYADGTWMDYPVKTKQKKPKPVSLVGIVIQNESGAFLLQRRDHKGVLADLFTFPLLAETEPLDAAAQGRLIQAEFKESYNLMLADLKPLGGKPVRHTFTHLKWTIDLWTAQLPSDADLSYFPGEWVAPSESDRFPVPTVQKKMMKRYLATVS
ncbi:hypothetical protein IV38_GL001401 [Lactobacillus selangorensis]|uniref:Adenine DNA glycosylase n=1 Tax=Lactobacillus selangorensis TaxID=81857 RepID=A0A0R2FV57_9LACO|nr:A/G-specific adenine glycosylase [Lactobacillus selangorensis]KRN28401.1 hypothetical protein IV38_GL001401 [Lactobacillus selangorensis]KRN31902.1 hypothetical protein IV40_GL001188 [Lactobacillus selangorensis]